MPFQIRYSCKNLLTWCVGKIKLAVDGVEDEAGFGVLLSTGGNYCCAVVVWI